MRDESEQQLESYYKGHIYCYGKFKPGDTVNPGSIFSSKEYLDLHELSTNIFGASSSHETSISINEELLMYPSQFQHQEIPKRFNLVAIQSALMGIADYKFRAQESDKAALCAMEMRLKNRKKEFCQRKSCQAGDVCPTFLAILDTAESIVKSQSHYLTRSSSSSIQNSSSNNHSTYARFSGFQPSDIILKLQQYYEECPKTLIAPGGHVLHKVSFGDLYKGGQYSQTPAVYVDVNDDFQIMMNGVIFQGVLKKKRDGVFFLCKVS
jgi:hypothetical protein